MRKPLVFCIRKQFFMGAAEQHRGSESERQQCGQEKWPTPQESETPDDERGKDKEINAQRIGHEPQTARFGLEFLPLQSDLRSIEALVQRLPDQLFPLRFPSVAYLPQSLSQPRGKTWRRRLK